MRTSPSPRTATVRRALAHPAAWLAIRIAASVLGLVALAPSPARAQLADSSFWRPDGAVYATVVQGNTIYVGGSFSRIAPYTGGCVPVDPTSGVALAGFPVIHGVVYAIVPDGAGGWFVGGTFASVGGLERRNIARVNADLSVAAWNPGANASVMTLAVHGAKLYVAGEFTTIGGQSRTGAAAFDVQSGEVAAWNPAPNSWVLTLAFDGGSVYAGGWFSGIGGAARSYVAALDTLTGAATSWDAGVDGPVKSVAIADGLVYVGGSFSNAGGQARANLAALDAVTATATSWNPAPSGDVRSLAVSGPLLYAGGSFRRVDGVSHPYLVAVDRTSGAATGWSPSPSATVTGIVARGGTVMVAGYFTSIGGAVRHHVAVLDSATSAPTAWDPWPSLPPLTISSSDAAVWLGGNFTSVGGVPRANLAALDVTTGLPTAWAPNPDGTVRALATKSGPLYVGGEFTQLAGVARARLGAVSVVTGGATAFAADANGTVDALALAGGDSALYVGGAFTSLAGVARSHLAAFVPASGSLSTWNPGATGAVDALLLRGNTLYVGGDLLGSSVMALSTITGAGTGWSPMVTGGPVRAIATSGQTVLIGGSFETVNGTSHAFFAALTASSGLLDSGWLGWGIDHEVDALLVDNGLLYAGGAFSTFGGLMRQKLAAVGATTSVAATWDPNPNGVVYALAASPGRLFAGGSFTWVGDRQTAYLGAVDPAPPISQSAVQLSVSHPDQPEGSSGWWPMVFVFQLSRAADQVVAVDYLTVDSTATVAGHDYLGASGRVTFQPGEITKTVTVQVNGDHTYERDERFLLRLSSPYGATLLAPSTFATLRNDDAIPTLNVTNVTLPEGANGATPFPFALTLTNPTYLPVTVNYVTADGTAMASLGDYVTTSGVATVPAESLTTTVIVPVNGDRTAEADETFVLNLQNIANAGQGVPYAIGTILNDDFLAALSVANVSLPEPASGTTPFTFTVTLSSTTGVPVTVLYATADGTATVADGDYVATSGVATVPADSLTTTITVLVNADTKPEIDETFSLELQGVTNATLATPHVVGTILSDAFGGDVTAVRDVAADQGGWVWLDVARNLYDDAAEALRPVATYNVWRLVPPASAEAVSLRGAVAATRASDAVSALGAEGRAALADWPLVVRDGVAYLRGGAVTSGLGQAFPPGTWAIANSFAALQRASYTVLAPTQSDSPGVAVYVVSAHTIQPAIWYVGRPDSGRSVDNLAPPAPTGFAATPAGAGVRLAWGASSAADFACFRVYRGPAPGFAVGPATQVQETTALEWTDDPPAAGTVYYQLAAVDSAGNVGPTAEASADAAGDDGGPPVAFALGAPAPSPFADATTLRFALPRAADVRIAVFDAAGRRVRDLAAGAWAAGVHAATWNGLDAAGVRAASGLYLVRMEAGEFRATRRIVLVR